MSAQKFRREPLRNLLLLLFSAVGIFRSECYLDIFWKLPAKLTEIFCELFSLFLIYRVKCNFRIAKHETVRYFPGAGFLPVIKQGRRKPGFINNGYCCSFFYYQ